MIPKGSIARVGAHYFSASEHKDDVLRAFRIFFNRLDSDSDGSLETTKIDEGLFNEWFLYNFILSSGETVLANFVAKNPLRLADAKMLFYRTLLENNTYGIFEVKYVDVGKGLKLENVQTKKRSYVFEQQLTYQIKRGNLFFGRIGRVYDQDELVGADTYSLDRIDEELKHALRKEHLELTPKIVYDFFSYGITCQ